MRNRKLRVVLLKPGKYGITGYVERFRRGFMPNATLPFMRSLTPEDIDGVTLETYAIDEYVETDLDYLALLHGTEHPTLLAFVGVQSHQFQRSLDLAAYAIENGVRHCIVGGPHPMTCDTSMLHGKGVSFALSEAEPVWLDILQDAISGELKPVYGLEGRWQAVLDSPVLRPPAVRDLDRYVFPMLGIYPARGCPFTCEFCSVIKIAGRRIRSENVETTISSLKAAKNSGVGLIMFTSDNFNKYPDATTLLERMIEERINLPFFIQCDTQLSQQEDFIELLGRAGCFEIFLGVESFDRNNLLAVNKVQNHPEKYGDIIRLCRAHGILTQFSNMIGFPADTRSSVMNQVDTLLELMPDYSAFYLMTPIPGTQQYDDYMSAGWLSDPNLDRYDGTWCVWRHPHFEAKELRELLLTCYRRFFGPRHYLATAWNTLKFHPLSHLVPALGPPLYTRWVADKGMHPMSGGVGYRELDHVSDYVHLRRKRYGYDLLPLPHSLQLSTADLAFNSDRRSNARSAVAVSRE